MTTRTLLAAGHLAVGFAACSASAQQIHEDLRVSVADATPTTWFGTSIAISEAGILISAPGWTTNPGKAFLFDPTLTNPSQTLLPPSASRTFGGWPGHADEINRGLAMLGNTAFVGASRDSVAGRGQPGAVYKYDLSSGMLSATLVADDAQDDDEFGCAVAVSEGFLLVGSQSHVSAGVEASGAVYVFDPVTGAQLRKIEPPHPFPGGRFGSEIAIAGSRAVIGTYFSQAPGGGTQGTGRVYVYDIPTGQLLRELTPPDPASTYHFGRTFAVAGELVLVRAAQGSDHPGEVIVFDIETGDIVRTLSPALPGSALGFGAMISTDGVHACVRSAYAGQTVVEVFDLASGTYYTALRSSDQTFGDRFGDSFVVRDGTVIVGAYAALNPSTGTRGAVYSFTIPSPCGPSDLVAPFGVLSFFDIAEYLRLFNESDPAADIAEPFGQLNVFDLMAFVDAYTTGCP